MKQNGMDETLQHDHIVRGTAAEGLVRAFAITCRETVQAAEDAHGANPLAITALGRLLAAGQMMGSMIKDDSERLTLLMQGDGPLGSLTVVVDNKGNAKGCIGNPDAWVDLRPDGSLDVGGALGNGTLTVVTSIPHLEPFASQVPLVTGEVGDDLTYYYAMSEQVPTSLGVGVLLDHDLQVKQAGGFIIQLMPGYDDALIDALEANLTGVASVTALLDEGMSPDDILAYLLRDMGYQRNDVMPVAYRCDCSEEVARRSVMALGADELADMVAKGEPAEVCCQYCGARYVFPVEELAELLA